MALLTDHEAGAASTSGRRANRTPARYLRNGPHRLVDREDGAMTARATRPGSGRQMMALPNGHLAMPTDSPTMKACE